MYTDIISREIAFEKLGLAPDTKITITGLPEQFSKVMEEVCDLVVISAAIREDYIPNYEDLSEPKFEQVWDLNTDSSNPSGFRFDFSFRTYSDSYSVLGPLLCQETKEKSDFFARQFEPLHRAVMKPGK